MLASSRVLRTVWVKQRRRIKVTRPTHLHGEWAALTGHPTASMLLLAYGVETYLKAGLAKWLQDCPNRTFSKALRQYSHDYAKLANDMEIPEAVASQASLADLTQVVLMDGRYPAEPLPDGNPIDAINQRTWRNWSRKRFNENFALASRLRAYVARLNSDEKNPTSTFRRSLDEEGYVVLRVGGNMPSRITFRSPKDSDWCLAEIDEWLDQCDNITVKHWWKVCDIYKENRKGFTDLIKRCPH